MELVSISDIIAGFAFREAVTADKHGDVLVFQAKDLVRGVFVTDVTNLTLISSSLTGRAEYLKTNDVLLIARGMKAGAFRSTVFKSDKSNVIASASVHIIRIVSTDVLPEYLSHYLNSKDGQNALSEIVSGSYIGALPRKALGGIKIPIPTLNKQQSIIDLYKNIEEQQKILDRRSELKQQIIDSTFKNIIKHHD